MEIIGETSANNVVGADKKRNFAHSDVVSYEKGLFICVKIAILGRRELISRSVQKRLRR